MKRRYPSARLSLSPLSISTLTQPNPSHRAHPPYCPLHLILPAASTSTRRTVSVYSVSLLGIERIINLTPRQRLAPAPSIALSSYIPFYNKVYPLHFIRQTVHPHCGYNHPYTVPRNPLITTEAIPTAATAAFDLCTKDNTIDTLDSSGQRSCSIRSLAEYT